MTLVYLWQTIVGHQVEIFGEKFISFIIVCTHKMYSYPRLGSVYDSPAFCPTPGAGRPSRISNPSTLQTDLAARLRSLRWLEMNQPK